MLRGSLPEELSGHCSRCCEVANILPARRTPSRAPKIARGGMFLALMVEGNNRPRAKFASMATNQPDTCGSVGECAAAESRHTSGVPLGPLLGPASFYSPQRQQGLAAFPERCWDLHPVALVHICVPSSVTPQPQPVLSVCVKQAAVAPVHTAATSTRRPQNSLSDLFFFFFF